MFAAAIHQVGGRSDRSFVALNCGALPSELLESELFGVEKGAYTGAQQSRPGRFERADGGTLFLDEVGELSMNAQTRLLRVLQDGVIDRLGSTATRKVDVRLIAATNVNLELAVESGKFRKDLFYRLNVYPVKIPPLRERRSDILLLTDRFVALIGAREGKRVQGLTDKARHALLAHDWPGNVRELENAVERALILTEDGAPIDASALFAGVLPADIAPVQDAPIGKRGQISYGAAAGADTVDLFLEHVFRQHIPFDSVETVLLDAAVKRAGGNLSEAARLLGLSRGQLAYRQKKRSEEA
jgi:two-component system response regulator HydG